MSEIPHQRGYQVYILRAWQERPASAHQEPVWRFSLEDTGSGQRIGFSDLENLRDFLQAQIARQSSPESDARLQITPGPHI